MGTVGKGNMVIGFMVSRNVRREIDRYAKELEMSRSEFVGFTVKWCLDNRKTITSTLGGLVLEAIGAMFEEEPRAGDEKLVPVQAVMSKATVAQVDRFAEKMKLSRVNALATLIEVGLRESALLVATLGGMVKTIKQERERRQVSAARGKA
ncbi:MAG TPA: hypothetical protein VGP72_18970 [Planctomycetota bacterium]|jgi:hypothetical protein